MSTVAAPDPAVAPHIANRDAVLGAISHLSPATALHALSWAAVRIRRQARSLRYSLKPMDTAPHDGTVIRIMFEHPNYRLAWDDDQYQWEELCDAHWIEHNGGGWTWHGIMGKPIGWLPAKENADG